MKVCCLSVSGVGVLQPWVDELCPSPVVHLEKQATGAPSKLVVACSYPFHANPLQASVSYSASYSACEEDVWSDPADTISMEP